jgi:CxxC motif-containing protein
VKKKNGTVSKGNRCPHGAKWAIGKEKGSSRVVVCEVRYGSSVGKGFSKTKFYLVNTVRLLYITA